MRGVPLQVRVAILDLDLSHGDVVARLLCAGADVVIYCCCPVPNGHAFWNSVKVYSLENDIGLLENADWVVELSSDAIEKRSLLYQRISKYLRSCNLISSNIPLGQFVALCGVVPVEVLSKLIVVHFPMFPGGERVLECAFRGEHSDNSSINVLKGLCQDRFALLTYTDRDVLLFDNIGCVLAIACLLGACEFKVGIDVADLLVSNEYTGVPPPGVFSLLDRMGIERFIAVLEGLVKCLDDTDPLRSLCKRLPRVIFDMIADGFVGDVGSRGGFRRVYNTYYGKVTQVIDLSTGLYGAANVSGFSVVDKGDIFDNGKHGDFSYFVWSEFFSYVKYLVSVRNVSISQVDDVLKVGYRWKYGVNELADKLGLQVL